MPAPIPRTGIRCAVGFTDAHNFSEGHDDLENSFYHNQQRRLSFFSLAGLLRREAWLWNIDVATTYQII